MRTSSQDNAVVIICGCRCDSSLWISSRYSTGIVAKKIHYLFYHIWQVFLQLTVGNSQRAVM